MSAPSQRRWWAGMVFVGGGLALGSALTLMTFRSGILYFPPLVTGFGAAMLIAYVIWWLGIHRWIISLSLGLGLLVIIYGSCQFTRYLVFLHEVETAYVAESLVTWEEAGQMAHEMLEAETGAGGFVGFIRYQMDTGMVITHGFAGPAHQVTGTNLLFYWALDVGAIVLGIGSGVWMARRRAFCDQCGCYYGGIWANAGDYGYTRIGWVKPWLGEEFLRLLQIGHFEQAGTLLTDSRPQFAAYDVLVEHCPNNHLPLTLSVCQARSRMNAQLFTRFKDGYDAETIERLTAFAGLAHPKQPAGIHRWIVEMTFLFAFLAAMLTLAGLIELF